MRFTSTTVRLARAGGVMTALLLGSFVSYAPTAGAQPTPPGGGGGITNPQPCGDDLQQPCPTDPCDTEAPPDDCPTPPCEDGQDPVDGECPPPDPCDTEMPPEGCLPVECDENQVPVDGECPPPP
ncbi:MAG TPA: hypothetical protein VGO78_21730, partial [Acidimicrobiales bacterium]|nr:hypothetical protein [Acidimicrobiales bacterium]